MWYSELEAGMISLFFDNLIWRLKHLPVEHAMIWRLACYSICVYLIRGLAMEAIMTFLPAVGVL
jgi:hypothetical protein